MKKEPALSVGTITALATAVLTLAAVFGFNLDTQTKAAILGVVAAVAPLVAAYFTRKKVVPQATHTAVVADMKAERDAAVATALATPAPDAKPYHDGNGAPGGGV